MTKAPQSVSQSPFDAVTGSTSDFFSKRNEEQQNISKADSRFYKSDKNIQTKISTAPNLTTLKGQISAQLTDFAKIISELDNNLDNLYIKSDLTPALYQAHLQLVNDIKRDTLVLKENFPSEYDKTYISYREYLYALEAKTRAGNILAYEYENVISDSSYSHFFAIKKVLKALMYEMNIIYRILNIDIGDTYDDKVEEQLATEFEYWQKTILQYKRQLATEITKKPTTLSTAEMDSISKIQAARFKAIFAVRVNSLSSEINSQISYFERNHITNAKAFYDEFVMPAVKFSSKVTSPLEYDIKSTRMASKAKGLTQELIIASSAISGHYVSLIADMVQRRQIMSTHLDNTIAAIRDKKKYIKYIQQLDGRAGSKRVNPFLSVAEDNLRDYFKLFYIDPLRSSTPRSSHAELDGLDEDSHPQYLLKAGGALSGSVTIDDGVLIDGITPSTHSHTGDDGSVKIKSTDIDYEFGRENAQDLNIDISMQVKSYEHNILVSGLPVVDAEIAINVEDGLQYIYDFEITYTKVD